MGRHPSDSAIEAFTSGRATSVHLVYNAFKSVMTQRVVTTLLHQLPSSLDPQFAAVGLFAIVDGLCFHWLLNPALFSMEEKAQSYVDNYFAGLASNR